MLTHLVATVTESGRDSAALIGVGITAGGAWVWRAVQDHKGRRATEGLIGELRSRPTPDQESVASRLGPIESRLRTHEERLCEHDSVLDALVEIRAAEADRARASEDAQRTAHNTARLEVLARRREQLTGGDGASTGVSPART